MLYTLQVVTGPASEPVTVQEMHDHLQLNTTAEDGLLSDYITTARALFENATGRPVIHTTFRQWFYQTGPVELVRGGVSSVTAWKFYDTSDTLQDMPDYETDLVNPVPCVWLAGGAYPATSANKSPVGYVEYVAGFGANATAVPAEVKAAIKLMAAHWFRSRPVFGDVSNADIPSGFKAVCALYATGLYSHRGVR